MPRFTSRKFLTTFVAQLAALAVLLFPQHESAIVEGSTSVAALLVLALSALGYVREEASLDRQHAKR